MKIVWIELTISIITSKAGFVFVQLFLCFHPQDLKNSNISQTSKLAYCYPCRGSVSEMLGLFSFTVILYCVVWKERSLWTDLRNQTTVCKNLMLVFFCEYSLNFLNHELQKKALRKSQAVVFKESENINDIKPTICWSLQTQVGWSNDGRQKV